MQCVCSKVGTGDITEAGRHTFLALAREGTNSLYLSWMRDDREIAKIVSLNLSFCLTVYPFFPLSLWGMWRKETFMSVSPSLQDTKQGSDCQFLN